MNFNPRSRERSDVTALGPVLIIIDFNPRSRERSDSSRVNLCLQSLHFNPRSRERSDYAGWNAIEIFYISIHAPARGATTDDEIQEQWCSISIHAPARGATIKRQVNPSSFTISIHAPARGATSFTTALSMYLTISIHAPARGATATCIIPYGAKDISIHAPARGATGKTLCYLIYQIFQSTLPREERPISPRMFPNAFYFNPRSRERSDVVGDQKHGTNIISIHAPARGATRFCSSCCCATDYFNPRSRERSDSVRKILQKLVEFQSTLPREERQQYCTKNLFIFIQYRQ